MKKTLLLLPLLAMMLACGGDDGYGPSWRDRDYRDEGNNQGGNNQGGNNHDDNNGKDPNDFGEYPTDNHAYVDLGLSVLWATCNMGATKPEQIGGYYFWGDPTGTATLEYMIANDPAKQFDYIGGSDYDIVHVMWGEKWRLPTPDEREELIDNCTFQWRRINGVVGAMFTSTVKGFEGNSIFLPAAGGVEGDSIIDAGLCGYYMTDELGSDEEGLYVHSLNFDELGVFVHTFGGSNPYECWASLDAKMSVRPVFGDVPKTSGNNQGGNKSRAARAAAQSVHRNMSKGLATTSTRRHR